MKAQVLARSRGRGVDSEAIQVLDAARMWLDATRVMAYDFDP